MKKGNMDTKEEVGKVRFRKVAIGCVTLILCAPILAYVGCVHLWNRAQMDAAVHPAPPITTWADREAAYPDHMTYTEGKVEYPAEGWITYNGTTTNKGQDTVMYWRLKVRFHPINAPKDKVADMVVDVEHVASSERLAPGETKAWKLMHKDDGTFPMFSWETVRLVRP
jgi:hypothetical protein